MTLRLPLCVVFCAGVCAAQSPVFEARELGEIPDGISLQGPPVTAPDGTQQDARSPVVFSPDGTRFAYVGFRGNASYPVLGEEVSEDAFDYISPPEFSADSATVVFRVGNRKSRTKEDWWPLVNGKKGKRYDWIGEIAVGPDGTLAFWEQPGAVIMADGSYNNGRQVLHFGKKKSKKFENATSLHAPVISADGKKAMAVGSKARTWFVVTLDSRGKQKELPKKGFSMIQNACLSPDGKRFAATASSEKGGAPMQPGAMPPPGMMPGVKLVVRDAKSEWGDDFEAAGCPVFSPDSKRIAYKFLEKNKMGIAFDKGATSRGRYDFVTTPAWSPDSRRVAYGVYTGCKFEPFFRFERYAETMVRGGKARLAIGKVGKEPKILNGEYDAIRHVAFGPKGKRVAFVAKAGDKWHVVEGDRKSEGFDQVGPPVFDTKSSRVGFGAVDGKTVWWKVLE